MNKVYSQIKEELETQVSAITSEVENLKAQIVKDEATIKEAQQEHDDAVLANNQKSYNAAELKKRLATEHMQLMQERLNHMTCGRTITFDAAEKYKVRIQEEYTNIVKKEKEEIKVLLDQVICIIQAADAEIDEGNKNLLLIHNGLYQERQGESWGNNDPTTPAMRNNPFGNGVYRNGYLDQIEKILQYCKPKSVQSKDEQVDSEMLQEETDDITVEVVEVPDDEKLKNKEGNENE